MSVCINIRFISKLNNHTDSNILLIKHLQTLNQPLSFISPNSNKFIQTQKSYSISLIDPIFFLNERFLQYILPFLILLIPIIRNHLYNPIPTYFHPTGSLELQTIQKISQTVCIPVVRRFLYSGPYIIFILYDGIDTRS